LEEIKRNSGTQFDPGVVRALMEAMASPDARQTGSAG
jgi:HD-GYP domain-containing protein (c-di-GMP phosphodiesterase class II)